MKRFLLGTLTFSSLLLCAGFVALWYRSATHCDSAATVTRTRHYVWSTFPGGVRMVTWSAPLQRPSWFEYRTYEYGVKNAKGAWMERPAVSWSKWGFDYKPLPLTFRLASRGAFEVFVPFWALVGLTIMPVLTAWINSLARRARIVQWRCGGCGHDLRGLPMGVQACPHCGEREDGTTEGRPSAI